MSVAPGGRFSDAPPSPAGADVGADAGCADGAATGCEAGADVCARAAEMVNMKAEMEIKALHQKIDLLLEEQIKVLFESHAKQLAILESLQEKIEKQS